MLASLSRLWGTRASVSQTEPQIKLSIFFAFSGRTICQLTVTPNWHGWKVKDSIAHGLRSEVQEEPITPIDRWCIRVFYKEKELTDEMMVCDILDEGNNELGLSVIGRTTACSSWLREDTSRAFSTFVFSDPEVKGDRECVMAAVRRDGNNLQFAPAYENDQEIVLAAASNCAEAVRFASIEIRDDIEFWLQMYDRVRVPSLAFAGLNVRSNRDCMLFAIERDAWTFNLASSPLQEDLEFVLSAIRRSHGTVFEFLPKHLADRLDMKRLSSLYRPKHGCLQGWCLSFAGRKCSTTKRG